MKIIFDITSLYYWNGPPVGIIRVTFEIARYLLTNSDKYNCKFIRIRSVCSTPIEIKTKEVKRMLYEPRKTKSNIISNIVNICTRKLRKLSKKIPSNTIRGVLRNLFVHFRNLITSPVDIFYIYRPEKIFNTGDIYLNTEGIGNNTSHQAINLIKNTFDLKFVGVFYDIIPLTHPQLFNKDFIEYYWKYFYHLNDSYDLLASISDYSKTEFLELATKLKIKPGPNIKTIHLGNFISTTYNKKADKNFINLFDNYVLIVCTIENRKNHLVLLKAWLEAEKMHIPMPNLICVGKPSSKSKTLSRTYKNSPYLKSKITFLEKVMDCDLDTLYQNCLFTVFPSFVEGWGLGVAESLSYGKACIISTAPALNEAARGLMPRLDPDDHMAWMNEISSLTHDQDKRLKLEEKIKNEFKERKWETFAKELIEFAIDGKN